jgi:hypothetical protein
MAKPSNLCSLVPNLEESTFKEEGVLQGVLKYNHKVFESIMHLPFEFYYVSRFHSHTVKGYKDLDASNQMI